MLEQLAPARAGSDRAALAGAPVSGAYKVDISRGERIGRVSSVWFSRPDDERYLSLGELHEAVRARAVRVSSGLFGTASAQLSLQDGWMLTAASGNSDSKAAETLTALAALATSIGKAVAGGAAPGGAPGGPDRTAAPPSSVLAPGLYAFNYDANTGRLHGLCRVTGFGPVNAPAATIPLCAAQLATGAAASIALLTTRSDYPAGSERLPLQ